MTKYTETFFSYCTCYDCIACGLLSSSDDSAPKCEECGLEMISADYCLEVCYRYKHEDWDEFVLPQWLDSVGNPSYVRIEGKNMGWTRASGQANIEADWQEIFRALTLNGDYRLVLEIEGKHFTVQRYSHDEPTGASFTIYPTVICGDCLYPDCICS